MWGLDDNEFPIPGQSPTIYADAAYPNRPGLQAAMKEMEIGDDADLLLYSRLMNSVRGEVEHAFRDLMCKF